MSTLPKAPLILLTILGTLSTWGLTYFDGSLHLLFTALHTPSYILPGTQTPLKTKFTGLWPVDYFLRILVLFFWDVVTGVNVGGSVVGMYFVVQLGVVVLGLYVEGVKYGGGRGVLRTSIWLLVFQVTGIAVSGPLWAWWYMKHSPVFSTRHFQELRSESPPSIRKIPAIVAAVAIAYVLPAIVMTLPSPGLTTHETKQVALVVWNFFPLSTLAVYTLLDFFIPEAGRRESGSEGRACRIVVRCVYAIFMAIGAMVHIAILSLSVATVLFPMLFNPKCRREVHPMNMLLPPVSIERAETVGDGVRGFMLWDQVFGYFVVLVMGLWGCRAACVSRGSGFGWGGWVVGTLGACALVGPGTVFSGLGLWRDEVVFGKGEEEGRVKE